MFDSQRAIGLTTKFFPFVAMMIVLMWTNTWIKDFVVWIGSFETVMLLLITTVAGSVLMYEGITQKRNAEFGGIIGAFVLWIIGGIIIGSGVAHFFNFINLFTMTGDYIVIFNFVWIIATLTMLVMALYEIIASEKLIITEPHKSHN